MIEFGAALGHWIELVLPEPPWDRPVPFVGFVYLDPEAGLSVRGGPADLPQAPPSLVVRLPIGVPARVLPTAEVVAAGRAVPPAWVAHYGAQPRTDATWRRDPALAGRWHKQFPDDLQVLVHDGEPRRSGRGPEGCWVRVVDERVVGERPTVAADRTAVARGAVAYVAELLNEPRHLSTVAVGDRVTFLPDPGGRYPLMVSDAYLGERAAWTIAACPRCGLAEGFDPPSVMARTRFPDTAGEIQAFTAFCPLCGPPSALSFERR